VMLVATLVPLRRALSYCLVVLLANLAAHALSGGLDDTPPETIIGLWIGFVFWSSAFAVFTERFAAYVLRLNAPAAPEAQRSPKPVASVDAEASDATRSAGDRADVETPSVAPADDGASRGEGSIGGLTARQLQVVALLADGLRYDEVAACLAISERQVQRHVGNAIERLGLRNANALVAVAVADGLVPRRPA
jgi:DNA-binding CsgD family transcriptional regulator